MKTPLLRLLLPALAAFLSASTAAFAATYVWDGGGANDSWKTAENWATDVAPVALDSLTFTGNVRLNAINNNTAGTRFTDILFDENAGAFTLSGNAFRLDGSVTNDSAALQMIAGNITLNLERTFNTAAGDMLLTGVLSDNGASTSSLAKTGAGTLTLTNANTFTGVIRVREGTLALDFSADGAPASNILGSVQSWFYGNNSTLKIIGNTTGTSSQTLGQMRFNNGHNVFVVDANGGSGTTLATGQWIRSAGSIADFRLSAGATVTSSNVTSTQGILPYATVNGTDFATVSGGVVSAFTGYTVLSGASPTITTGETQTIKIDATSSGEIGQSANTTTINSLLMNDAAARTITVGAGRIFALGGTTATTNGQNRVGAIFTTSGAGELTIGASGNAGSLSVGPGGGTNANELLFITDSARVTVNSAVINRSSNSTTALSKTGAGIVALNGVNTYTGATLVNEGTLLVNGSLAAASTVTVNSTGTLGGIGTINGAATFNSGATLAPGASDDTAGKLTFAGAVTLNAGSSLSVYLNQAGVAGTDYDQVAAGGAVALDGATLSLSLGDAFDSGATLNQTFTVLTSAGLTGTLTDGTSITATTGAATYTFGIDYGTISAGALTLTLTGITSTIPEPSSYAMVVGGLALAGAVLRRRAGPAARR